MAGLTSVSAARSLLTLAETLRTPRLVHIASDQSLADAVGREQTAKGMTGRGRRRHRAVPRKTPLSSVANVGDTLITPIELLHAIGKATTPQDADLAALASLWAVIRYLWAFAPGSGPLRVSDDAKALAFHQKTLFSEQLGMGSTWLLTESAYVKRYGADAVVRVADAEKAIKAQMLDDPLLRRRVRVDRLAGLYPDGIAFTISPTGGAQHLRAIESKGCHSRAVTVRPREMRRALADASVQVSSLLVGGRSLEGWMFCAAVAQAGARWPGMTALGQDGVGVFALDPPGEERDDPPPRDDAQAWQREGGAWSIADPESFQHKLVAFSSAGLLTYAGAIEEAQRIAPLTRPGKRRPTTGPLVGDATRLDDRAPLSTYQGTEITLRPTEDVALRVFFGLDREVRGALAEGTEAQVAQTTRAFRERRGPRSQNSDHLAAYETEAQDDLERPPEQVRSIGVDGSVLDVRIEAPASVLAAALGR